MQPAVVHPISHPSPSTLAGVVSSPAAGLGERTGRSREQFAQPGSSRQSWLLLRRLGLPPFAAAATLLLSPSSKTDLSSSCPPLNCCRRKDLQDQLSPAGSPAVDACASCRSAAACAPAGSPCTVWHAPTVAGIAASTFPHCGAGARSATPSPLARATSRAPTWAACLAGRRARRRASGGSHAGVCLRAMGGISTAEHHGRAGWLAGWQAPRPTGNPGSKPPGVPRWRWSAARPAAADPPAAACLPWRLPLPLVQLQQGQCGQGRHVGRGHAVRLPAQPQEVHPRCGGAVREAVRVANGVAGWRAS